MQKVTIYVSFLLVFIVSFPAFSQISFPAGSTFKLMKGNATSATPAELLSANYNDNTWTSGPAPYRYFKGNGGTVLSDMKGVYSTFILRSKFTVANAAGISKITVSADYDDGFVLAINGHVVMSQNAPATLSTTALAPVNHDPGTSESFTLDTAGMHLKNGENALAVMVFNTSISSSDIYFDVALSATPALPPFPTTDKVQFSSRGGFYTSPFTLNMTSPIPGCTIRYTIDGSDPATSATAKSGGATTSALIDPAITTGRGATPGFVVRACLIKEGYNPSYTATQTYIFKAKVKTQTYPGAPWPGAGYTNGQLMDYNMVSDVVSSSTYAPYIDAALNQIPTISLVADMDNLFSAANGIYVNASDTGDIWEKPCSVELIDTSNINQFQVNAGMKMRGAASSGGDNPKHAFRLFFRSKYGDSKLRFPLFEKEGTDEFDCMDLRCEQNWSWSKDKSKYCSFVTDIFSRDLQGKMGQPYKRGRYYHLYLNGMYWGLYQTDERAQSDYAESYFGGNSDDYDIIKVNSTNWPYVDEAGDGLINTWAELYNKCSTGFSQNSNYFALLGKKSDGTYDPNGKVWVELDNLIDYMLVIFYTGNFDAPVSSWYNDDMPNNFFAIYNRNDKTHGFRFLAHDSEHSMFVDALSPGAGLQENRVSLGSSGRMNITKMIDFNPQWLHYKMSSNLEYKQRFIDRAYDRFRTGGLLTPDSTMALYKKRAAEIDNAVIAESARWGGSRNPEPLTKATWQTLINSMYTDFFPKRSDIVKQQLQAEGLYSTMTSLDVYLNGSIRYNNYIPFQDTATIRIADPNSLTSGATMYYTTDGNDPRMVGGSLYSKAVIGKGAVNVRVNQTTVINARLYRFGTWGPLRQIVLCNSNEDYSNLKITEIQYHPKDSILGTDTIDGDDLEFIEFKNTGTKPIDLTGLKFTAGVEYAFPNETLLNPEAFFVIASKPNSFYKRYQLFPSGNYAKNLSNSGESITIVDKTGRIIFDIPYDDNAPWAQSADGDGYSLVSKYKKPTGDPASADYWVASAAINGSPFMDDPGSILISVQNTPVSDNIIVYPNPAHGECFIKTNSLEDCKITVYDMNGKIITEKTCNRVLHLDLRNYQLNSGIYLVKIQFENQTITKKIVFIR